MGTVLERGPNSSIPYGEKEVRRGLIAVAEANGNCAAAERLLKDDGMPVDDSTLWVWKTRSYKELYEQIRLEVLPKVTAQAIEEHRALAQRARGIEAQFMDRLADNVDKVQPRDLAGSLRNVGTTSAIHEDKAQLLAGMPTEIKGEQSAEQVLRSLNGRGIKIEATEKVVERKVTVSADEA